MKVISFSLWGTLPKYCVGAVRNAELAPIIYPGWVARFYVGTSVPQATIEALKQAGADLRLMPDSGDWKGMFWRFLAASDEAVDVMLSRDCDSRLNEREKAAVEAWLASDAAFHIMRDHPRHTAPIMGGMWGCKAPLLRDISTRIASYAADSRYGVDQDFLAELYPTLKGFALEHDDVNGVPFPTPRSGVEFVGEVFDDRERTDPEHAVELFLGQ